MDSMRQMYGDDEEAHMVGAIAEQDSDGEHSWVHCRAIIVCLYLSTNNTVYLNFDFIYLLLKQ